MAGKLRKSPECALSWCPSSRSSSSFLWAEIGERGRIKDGNVRLCRLTNVTLFRDFHRDALLTYSRRRLLDHQPVQILCFEVGSWSYSTNSYSMLEEINPLPLPYPVPCPLPSPNIHVHSSTPFHNQFSLDLNLRFPVALSPLMLKYSTLGQIHRSSDSMAMPVIHVLCYTVSAPLVSHISCQLLFNIFYLFNQYSIRPLTNALQRAFILKEVFIPW